eukprot:6059289-Ditylum_brightwellii.AAC.1
MKRSPAFITITPLLQEALKDWNTIIKYLKTNPTSVLQLVKEYPNYIGHTDACGLGTNGVWSAGTEELQPFVWHQEWPPDIKARLKTSDNLTGDLSMNNLELA